MATLLMECVVYLGNLHEPYWSCSRESGALAWMLQANSRQRWQLTRKHAHTNISIMTEHNRQHQTAAVVVVVVAAAVALISAKSAISSTLSNLYRRRTHSHTYSCLSSHLVGALISTERLLCCFCFRFCYCWCLLQKLR